MVAWGASSPFGDNPFSAPNSDADAELMEERRAINWANPPKRPVDKFHRRRKVRPFDHLPLIRGDGSVEPEERPAMNWTEQVRARRMATFPENLAIPGVQGARVHSLDSLTTISDNPDEVSQWCGESSCDESQEWCPLSRTSDDELSLHEGE
jgi:hypothetical protein